MLNIGVWQRVFIAEPTKLPATLHKYIIPQHQNDNDDTDRPYAIVDGPLLAWKLWYCKKDEKKNWILRSLSNATLWPPREPMVANHCQWGIHTVPSATCYCGIYARKIEEDETEQRLEMEIEFKKAWKDGCYLYTVAVGTVLIWGRVIEHELGYRAEYAYPTSLCVLNYNDSTGKATEIANDLSESYFVPIQTCNVYPVYASLIHNDYGPAAYRFERNINFAVDNEERYPIAPTK